MKHDALSGQLNEVWENGFAEEEYGSCQEEGFSSALIITDDIIGIIHVGANVGREVHRYETRGVKSVVWIEPIKTCFDALKKRVENCPTIESQVFNELISDVEGEELRFFEHYKSGVSSIYELNTSSEQFHGRNLNTLKVRNQTVIKAITLRSLISQNNIDLDKFNCLVVDTQGSELKVLKGLKDDIKKFKYNSC